MYNFDHRKCAISIAVDNVRLFRSGRRIKLELRNRDCIRRVWRCDEYIPRRNGEVGSISARPSGHAAAKRREVVFPEVRGEERLRAHTPVAV